MAASETTLQRASESTAVASLSREAIAHREVGHTEVKRAVAWALLAIFLATVVTVPVIQHAYELREARAGRRQTTWPQMYDIVWRLPDAMRVFQHTKGSWWSRTVAANRSLLSAITSYEDALEDASVVSRAVLPEAHQIFAHLGAGNEEAYIGRDGWLFFRPDVDYVTAPGFLSPYWQIRRAANATAEGGAPQPDPRLAILQFRDQLASRGVQLVVMPTPTKATIHPEKFAARFSGGSAMLQNVAYGQFVRDLEQAGVLVFDPAPLLTAARHADGADQYLATDTHWRPQAMESVARGLADFIRGHGSLPSCAQPGLTVAEAEVSNLGDVAEMLQLPGDQTIFPPETVRIHPVMGAGGLGWRPDRAGDVLVLGDSFSNIYSLGAMGWGESAGLVEHLAFRLQRPVDCILRNDAGAHATREILARELARGRDRLAGKRVVVWQFAVRELAFGDWKLLDLEPGERPLRKFIAPSEKDTWVVTGTVEQVSAAPRPGSVPYKDHIIALHVTDVMGSGKATAGRDVLVYVWSMRDNVLTPAAGLRGGDQVRIRLRAWSAVADEFERFNRSELPDESLQFEEPSWGELVGEP